MKAPFGIVWKKEVTENFRDWRTLLPALVIGPILSPVLMGVLLTYVLQRAVEKQTENLHLPVIGAEHAPNLVRFLAANGVEVLPPPVTSPDAATTNGVRFTRSATVAHDELARAVAAVRSRAHEAVLVVAPTIGADIAEGRTATVELIVDRGRRSSALEGQRAAAVLLAYGQQLGALRLFARGVDPRVMQPLAIDQIDVSTPSGRSVVLLGMLTYVILFAVLMGGLHITNDATAGERERKSLEPLLTLPVGRGQLVIEKILAAASFMVIALAVVLTVLMLGLGQLPLEQLGMQSNFGPLEALLAFVLLLPFVFFGAGLMSVVASFTKTYKEAQTYLGFLVLVPTLPIIFAGVAELRPSLSLMFVPSLSQHFLLLSLMKAEPLEPAYIAASIATTLLVAAVATLIAVRLYQRESLLG